MQKLVVFTDDEWQQFRVDVGLALSRDIGEHYTVTTNEKGERIIGHNWWIGTVALAIEQALNK